MPDFSPASPDLLARLDRLIAAYHPHLRDARLEVQMRDKAQANSGSVAWAEVDTADNDAEARAFDFTVWFAADVWAKLDETQRDALADHELYHCQYDEAGKPTLVPHDIQEFNAIIARYGLWWPDADETRRALQQQPRQGQEENEMPGFSSYQRPQPGGSSGSTGAYNLPMQGNHGSTGAYAQPVWSDPMLQEGGDFHTIDLGDGRVIELSPQAYAAAIASILADLQTAMGNAAPQPGQSGSTGV